jgi:hypothetical protein
MEMSPYPERALKAGDELRDLVPDAGHLRHMPTHLDVLCGQYRDVVVGNEKAIEADRKYLEREGPLNFYSLYRCHDYHFKLYGAMFLGQLGPALEAAEEMVATLPPELLRIEAPPMADWLEGFVPMKMHVLVQADAVYRADLGLDTTLSRACQHPDNVWSLHGLHECLRRLGKTAEADLVRQRLELASARADVPIRAGCYCRLEHAA